MDAGFHGLRPFVFMPFEKDMAQLADILQQERDRDTADKWGIIHLYAE